MNNFEWKDFKKGMKANFILKNNIILGEGIIIEKNIKQLRIKYTNKDHDWFNTYLNRKSTINFLNNHLNFKIDKFNQNMKELLK